MAKKVLIISASPRKGSNSDALCEEFKRGAIEIGHYVEKVLLRDKQISYCVGCGACIINGYTNCSQKDDMSELLDKMIDFDVIVFASPVYFYTINAQMKTFIDRCCARHTKISNKEFYYIVTAADTDRNMMDRTIECFRGFLDCLENPVEKGILKGVGLEGRGEALSTDYAQVAYNMGKQV